LRREASRAWGELPVRYLAVAGACLVMHNIIVITASRAGLNLWQAAATSFCIMVVAGYLLLATLVFDSGYSMRAFFRYVAAMAFNFPISTALLWLFFAAARQPMEIAAPAATIVMVAYNFVASRWAVAARTHRASARPQ
jgi:putative flippase GtrA